MKAWHAAMAALLMLFPPSAAAADDASGAAREMARKTAALVGRGEPVAVTWRNLSSLDSSDLAQARAAFEAAFKESGNRISDIAPLAETRITVSENRTQFLLVEEIRKGEERQVWIASWRRSEPTGVASMGLTLEKKLLWEQEEQILDLAVFSGGMLALSPSKLSWYTRQNGGWTLRAAASLVPARPWPRDLRGRLRVMGSSIQAFLPGMMCSGAAEQDLTLQCKAADEPWTLESGGRYLLLANFASPRNYFDGRIVTQSGTRKTAPAFYSAAAVEDQGRVLWLLALLDGRTQVFDSTLEPLQAFTGWGSDIAATGSRCGSASLALATRPGDAGDPDAIQAYTISRGAPAPVGPPVDFPGAITALWNAAADSVLAVARDARAGTYSAYSVRVVCGE